MSVDDFSVRWRPSGGRGEYEYVTEDHGLREKTIIVQLPPPIEKRFATDVRTAHVDGKPRLRRERPSDRTVLNLHCLIAALLALPEPRREDVAQPIYPLVSKSFVVEEVAFRIIDRSGAKLTVLPVSLKIKHIPKVLDVSSRLQDVLAQQAQPPIAAFLSLLSEGNNTARLAELAAAAHEAHPITLFSLPTFALDQPDPLDDIVETHGAKEGRELLVFHRRRERDPNLVARARRAFKQKYGKLFCEVCGLDMARKYPGIGDDFVEVHHRLPLSAEVGERTTQLTDLAMVCPNCHRMIHRATDGIGVEDLRRLLTLAGLTEDLKNLNLLDES